VELKGTTALGKNQILIRTIELVDEEKKTTPKKVRRAKLIDRSPMQI